MLFMGLFLGCLSSPRRTSRAGEDIWRAISAAEANLPWDKSFSRDVETHAAARFMYGPVGRVQMKETDVAADCAPFRSRHSPFGLYRTMVTEQAPVPMQSSLLAVDEVTG
jgi:hypothetical protein